MRHSDKGVYSKSIMLLKIWFYSRSYDGVFVISSIPDPPHTYCSFCQTFPSTVACQCPHGGPDYVSGTLLYKTFFSLELSDNIMTSTDFFNVMTCRLVYRCLCFGGTRCVRLHIQYNLYSFSFAIIILNS